MKKVLSLTDFKRKSGDLLKRLKKTGTPLTLTVNGKQEVIVQDATAYQQMLERLERLEAIEGIQKGLESVAKGRTRSVEEAFAEMRRKHDIPD